MIKIEIGDEKTDNNERKENKTRKREGKCDINYWGIVKKKWGKRESENVKRDEEKRDQQPSPFLPRASPSSPGVRVGFTQRPALPNTLTPTTTSCYDDDDDDDDGVCPFSDLAEDTAFTACYLPPLFTAWQRSDGLVDCVSEGLMCWRLRTWYNRGSRTDWLTDWHFIFCQLLVFSITDLINTEKAWLHCARLR